VNVNEASPWAHHVFIAALKFLYNITLGRPEETTGIAYPKLPHPIMGVLSATEVVSLLEAIPSVRDRTIVTATHGAGLGISESCGLLVTDIDSKRKLIDALDQVHRRIRHPATEARSPYACGNRGPHAAQRFASRSCR
jgi:site-specific recombinase XerD